ncbi:hypothetical protein DNTS_013081, partial [Danionella cerebrum]
RQADPFSDLTVLALTEGDCVSLTLSFLFPPAARSRPAMAAPSSSGLEVLLDTLQSRNLNPQLWSSFSEDYCPLPVTRQLLLLLTRGPRVPAGYESYHVRIADTMLEDCANAGDIESMLNILNVLDELLSAGTDRRIHHMISKGGSEALLTALVNSARSFTPNYTILLPLLHLLAKVGNRDCHIGLKAENTDAVPVVLGLLRQNITNPRRVNACLWVLRVFCSSVSTAELLGKNRGMDVVFKQISPYTTKHLRTVKAAIDAFAAMLCSKQNCRTAVTKGYISDLLKLYEDWHNNDGDLKNIPIRKALLHCLHSASNSAVGREAITFLSARGLESLMELAIQLMRKCNPKIPLPLTSDKSAYRFPLPGRPVDDWAADLGLYDGSLEDDSDEDAENTEPDNRDYEDDLETDVNKLCPRPEPDRPLEQLGQYVHLCPELHHDFQRDIILPSVEEENHLKTSDFHKHYLSCSRKEQGHSSMVDKLLEKYGACIPNHDPRLYAATAACTKSVAGFSILAFPDFWGHLPPKEQEPMVKRPPNVQSPQRSPDTYEYDLILNADANSSAHYQWFYFEVSNMEAGVPYRFNIINCEKGNSQYNYGMQPVVYSVREALAGRPHWLRTGSEICYYRNHFCPRGGQKQSFYTLTFTVTFHHDDDVCYLAYHYPYTYTALQTHLKMLEKSVDPRKVFFRHQNLCDTLAGNSCSIVTITASPASRAWKHLHQ